MAIKQEAGVIGFRVNFVDKITYVHNGLGIEEKILEWGRGQEDWKLSKRLALAMKLVTGTPTDDQILQYCINTGVDIPDVDTLTTWYQIMRPNQGNLSKVLLGKFYMSYKFFMVNSKLCKFAYIINLDRLELEVYKRGEGNCRYKGWTLSEVKDLRKL